MNTREIASEYRLAHWAGILQERSSRGISIKTFCKTAGIHQNVYYYWQRKLRETACEELTARLQKDDGYRGTSLIPNGWTACKSDEPAPLKKSLVVEINGCRVQVEPYTDPEQLAMVLRVLKSL